MANYPILAKPRLQKTASSTSVNFQVNKIHRNLNNKPFLNSIKNIQWQLLFSQWIIARQKFFPLLAVFFAALALLIYVLFNFYPSSIIDLILPNSYLLLLTLVFIASTSLATIFLAHIRRGFLFGLFISALLFFYLQSISINIIIIFSLLLWLTCLELYSIALFRWIIPKFSNVSITSSRRERKRSKFNTNKLILKLK